MEPRGCPKQRDSNYSPLNQVQAARRLHDAADVTRVQTKGSFFKLPLHVTLAEVAQVTPLTGTAAVGLGQGQLAERGGTGLDLGLVSLDDLECVLLGAGNFGLF